MQRITTINSYEKDYKIWSTSIKQTVIKPNETIIEEHEKNMSLFRFILCGYLKE